MDALNELTGAAAMPRLVRLARGRPRRPDPVTASMKPDQAFGTSLASTATRRVRTPLQPTPLGPCRGNEPRT
jgi:hypothetical protein